jgi:hypothetical protein
VIFWVEMFLQKIRAGEFFLKGSFCGKFPVSKVKKYSPQIIFQGQGKNKMKNCFFSIFWHCFFFFLSFWVGGFSPVFDRFLQTCCQLMLNPFWDAHYSLIQ